MWRYHTVLCPAYHTRRKINCFLCLQKHYAALHKTQCWRVVFPAFYSIAARRSLCTASCELSLRVVPKVRIQGGRMPENKYIYFLASSLPESAPSVLPAVIIHKRRCIRTGERLCCKRRGKRHANIEFCEGRRNAFADKGNNLFFVGCDMPDRGQCDTATLPQVNKRLP